MKNSSLILLLWFIGNAVFGQNVPRELLSGRIVSDSLSTENITIRNTATDRFSVSDYEGSYQIYAKANDTLVFSGMTFQSKKVILRESDFKLNEFKTQLESYINTLDEVVIDPRALTGNLEKDGNNIKIAKMPAIDVQKALATPTPDHERKRIDNRVMPGYVDMSYSMNLVEVAKLFGKLVGGKPKPKAVVFTSDKIFPVAAQERLPASFFTKTLKLDENEIGLFLSYCEQDPRAIPLLEVKKEFQLIDFLISKADAYKQNKKE